MSIEAYGLGPDHSLVENWVIEATFLVGSLTEAEFINLHLRDIESADPETLFIMDNDMQAGTLNLSTNSPLHGTQYAVLVQASERYKQVLGDMARSQRLKSAAMNLSSIVEGILAPYFPDKEMDIDEWEEWFATATEDELKRISECPKPPMLDVTADLARLLG